MSLKQEVDKNSENIELLSVSKTKDLKQCKQFDVVEDCSDNHFANGKGAALSQMKKGWLKKVQQEWTILEKDLPEAIYDRIYEERMDLLRAAIVGAPGAPYHDGLFFFDIMLPPDYPHVPPVIINILQFYSNVGRKTCYSHSRLVLAAEQKLIEDAIRCGGLAPTKASYIQYILSCL